ncbi:hypothetical protein AIT98_002035 [Salmonella enterica subsp. indica]|uniref:TioA protein n=1 Tax=Salmonella enterica TaxID=28901 RepID=A0A701ZAP3_SALER|nr:hypothetical protein [Salmonella enterica]HAC6573408.1 hypothetical protein [Salmonella enterica subsp. indica]HBC0060765.1 hypothetical protein [Salmonella enterica]HCL5303268.1 hypothetical protein [Salmonella enterica]
MQKINICIFIFLININSYALANCYMPSKKTNQVNTLDPHVNKKPFDIKKLGIERIRNDENSFFIWKNVDGYHFSFYPAYLNSGFTREKIQYDVFFCSIDEIDYIFENNAGNEISFYLINSPFDNGFLDRQNKLLVKRDMYYYAVDYLYKRSAKYKVKLFILDDDNFGKSISRQIK